MEVPLSFNKRMFFNLNWPLLIFTAILFCIGLINLYSTSSSRVEGGIILSAFFAKQAIWGLLGVFVIIGSTLINYRTVERLAIVAYVIVIILLLMVPLFGKTVYGAQRWLDFRLFSLQPSELAKFAVLILGAKVLASESKSLDWISLFKIAIVGLIPFILIVRQPDLGTAVTVLFLVGAMACFHGIKWKVLRICLLLIPLILPLAWFALHDYQQERIITFLDPSSDPRGSGYHIIQSQIALGSGGTFGKGFQEGTQSQMRFLPERHTDFALAVLGEEWGFMGTMGLTILFCLFLLSIYSTVRNAKDRFGSTLCAGIFFYFFWQIVVNMGMVCGLMPVVGIPLPFISYGGSATIVNCALVGLVLNVSMRRFLF